MASYKARLQRDLDEWIADGLVPAQNRETILARQKEYFAANPQVKAEMTAIRQPLIDAKLRCGSTPESLGIEAG